MTIDIRSLGSLMHTSCSKQLSYSFLGPFRHFFMLPPILVNSTNDRSPEFWPLTSNDLRLASNFACSEELAANLCIPNFIQFREKKNFRFGLVCFAYKSGLAHPPYLVIKCNLMQEMQANIKICKYLLFIIHLNVESMRWFKCNMTYRKRETWEILGPS